MQTYKLMTQVTHLLVFFKVSTEYTSILSLLTLLLHSTTLWDTKLAIKPGWGRPQGAEGTGWIALALVIFGGWDPIIHRGATLGTRTP